MSGFNRRYIRVWFLSSFPKWWVVPPINIHFPSFTMRRLVNRGCGGKINKNFRSFQASWKRRELQMSPCTLLKRLKRLRRRKNWQRARRSASASWSSQTSDCALWCLKNMIRTIRVIPTRWVLRWHHQNIDVFLSWDRFRKPFHIRRTTFLGGMTSHSPTWTKSTRTPTKSTKLCRRSRRTAQKSTPSE